MNKTYDEEIHEAVTKLAAGRTAYSLARELLGCSAELREVRKRAGAYHDSLSRMHDTLEQMEAEEGQEILALRQELAQVEAATLERLAGLASLNLTGAQRSAIQEIAAATRRDAVDKRAGCPACESRPGQYHNPECPAVNAFTAGRIPPVQNSAQAGPAAANSGQHSAHHGGGA